jgi:allantoinase
MCIPLHSYLIGQPHRIGAFQEVLRHIAADGRAWITRAGDIADHYLANHNDDMAAARNPSGDF